MKAYHWLGVIITYLLIPLILFISAGVLAWWQAWVYAVMILGVGIGARLWGEHRHPGMMAERLRIGKHDDVKRWDKVLAPLMAISIGYPMAIVAGLDHRFGWSNTFPIWVNLLGLLLIALGYIFASWAMAENRFFSTVVRIQRERGHVVCDSGPYRFVRHPGYAGNILPLFGMVLAFNSVWTLIPAAVAMLITLLRTELEDRALQEELPGYGQYAQRVRYRLIPGIY